MSPKKAPKQQTKLQIARAKATEKMATMYAAGKTTSEIADKFGVSAANVYVRIKGAGVQIRKPGSQPTIPDDNAKLKKKLIDAYNSGDSIGLISENTGYSPAAVRHFLVRNQVTIRPTGRPSNKIDEKVTKKVVKLYQAGTGMPQIAESMGMSEYSVRQALIESSIPIRRRGRRSEGIDAKIVRQVLKLSKSGMLLREIANETGLTIHYVRRCLDGRTEAGAAPPAKQAPAKAAPAKKATIKKAAAKKPAPAANKRKK